MKRAHINVLIFQVVLRISSELLPGADVTNLSHPEKGVPVVRTGGGLVLVLQRQIVFFKISLFHFFKMSLVRKANT